VTYIYIQCNGHNVQWLCLALVMMSLTTCAWHSHRRKANGGGHFIVRWSETFARLGHRERTFPSTLPPSNCTSSTATEAPSRRLAAIDHRKLLLAQLPGIEQNLA
jgi:hypothetical protein